MELVSIIIPIFNQGNYIVQTLDAVQRQSYKNIELIVVDDGSTDEYTKSILDDISMRHDISFYRKRNGGLSSARNFGIDRANGNFIICLDSDDLISKNYVRALVNEISSDFSVRIAYSNGYLFDARNGFWYLPEFKENIFLLKNTIHCSAIFYKEDWIKVGGYNEALEKGWEDWDFWISLIATGCKVKKIQRPYFFYRIRQDSMSRSMTAEYKEFAIHEIFNRNKELFMKNNVTEGDISVYRLGMVERISFHLRRMFYSLFFSKKAFKEISGILNKKN